MTTKTGKQVRLHFAPGGVVDEAKRLPTVAAAAPPRTRLADHLTRLRGAGKFPRAR